METFTLWLAVDDSSRENGCMQVIPGSHRERVVHDHLVEQNNGSTLPLQVEGTDLTEIVDVLTAIQLICRCPTPTSTMMNQHGGMMTSRMLIAA